MASRKYINIYSLKYFMAVRNCINIYIQFFCTFRGSLYDLVAFNEPFIHFATVQLIREFTKIGENFTRL